VVYFIYLFTGFRQRNVQYVKGKILVLLKQKKWGKRIISTIISKTKGRWGMIISHHAPIDYDRTLKFFNIRVCARCSGVFIGLITILLIFSTIIITRKIYLVYLISFLLPLPAMLDFMGHELKWYKSNNFIRIFSGILLGIPLGVSIVLTKVSFYYLFLIIVWYCLIEIFVVHFFKIKNHLDNYYTKYTNGIVK